MIKSLQPCPKRYLLMQLARVAPRLAGYSESMVSLYDYKRTRKRMNYSERRGQFPRMRILIRPQVGDAVRYAPRVCTSVLCISDCNGMLMQQFAMENAHAHREALNSEIEHFNFWRTCAARVTVVVSRVCVCVCVKLAVVTD